MMNDKGLYDTVGVALLWLCVAAAVAAFAMGMSGFTEAGPDTRVVEAWRLFGYLVFAGLLVLLALRPRYYAGVWELVLLHKVALTVTSAMLIPTQARDAVAVTIADGALAAVLLAAYLFTGGYRAWGRSMECLADEA